MALPSFPTDEATFLAALNGNTFDPTSNPFGLANGGHRQLAPTAFNNTADMANYFAAMGAFLLDLAAQVAADADSAADGSGTESSVVNMRAGTSAQYMSIRRAYEANVPVVLVDAANVAWDMATGINFKVTPGASNRTLVNPTNSVPGKSGLLRVIQDATGGRGFAAYGNAYVWIGGQPAWPTVPNARSLVSFFCTEDGKVELTFGGSSA